ncbi:SpvB/TcaC N-terminal domain-containing protein [Pleionea sediminis]|uniref:SpvB/TcaC N-terminal domain-containing protein n=1 Tax=Pleionea sediminis TaxID=2569479 RepID=UPI00118487ED|nr:SpvB/TcaC N-terminal domain-containing protein [Pleionea sediminis]
MLLYCCELVTQKKQKGNSFLWLVISLLLLVSSTVRGSGVNTASDPHVLSLPTGPGSIDGLGERFSLAPNTGTSQYQVPIDVPPGRAGFSPSLSIEYSNGYGNGLLGVGMQLSVPYLQRQTDKGLPVYEDWLSGNRRDSDGDGEVDEFDEADTYIDNTGKELVYVKDNLYRAQVEDGFILYEKLEQGWRWHFPNGSKLTLGTRSTSRVEGLHPLQANKLVVYRWYPDSMVDSNGNEIKYIYQKVDGDAYPYLAEITYNHSEASHVGLRFNYEFRPDVLTDFRSGFELRISQRLTEISTYAGNKEGISYKIDYEAISSLQPVSLIKSIQKQSFNKSTSLPPIQFTWSQFDTQNALRAAMPKVQPMPINSKDTLFFDLNADGLPDVINTGYRNNHYWLNQGADEQGVVQFSGRKQMERASTRKFSNSNVRVADVNGDGKSDVLTFSTNNVSVISPAEVDNAAGNSEIFWKPHGLLSKPGVAFNDSSVRFVDVNHDKRVDALLIKRGSHAVSLNLENGWTRGIPLPIDRTAQSLDLANQNVYLADMNGDRLMDLVLVAAFNDRFVVSYYPGRGLNGFGSRIGFQTVYSRQLYSDAINFNDVNGDGRADLVHLNGRFAEIWLNHGLTAQQSLRHDTALFSERQLIVSPLNQRYPTAKLVDINGNGSQDIVWYELDRYGSSFAFADLSPETQPYQIQSINNGIGKTISFEYASVVSEMLRDANAGNEWQHKVPFGMQVVKAVQSHDAIGNITERTEYHYTNGLYHVGEKTFWGFEKSTELLIGDSLNETQVIKSSYLLGKEQTSLKGKAISVEFLDGENRLFKRVKTVWESAEVEESSEHEERTIEQAQARSVESQHFEGKGESERLTVRTEYEYDSFGNITKIFELGCLEYLKNEACHSDQRITETTFSASYPAARDAWILDRVVSTSVSDDEQSVYKKEHYFYDDESFSGSNLGVFSSGNLTMIHAWVNPNSSDEVIAASRFKYDDYGNVSDVYDPLWGKEAGHHTQLGYDSTYHSFLTSRTLNTGELLLTESAEVDPLWGAITWHEDFNGQRQSFLYDDLGRLSSIIRVGDSEALPSSRYSYQLQALQNDNELVNYIETKKKSSDDGDYIVSRSYFDGFGRLLQTRSEGAKPEQVIVNEHFRFNRRGFVDKTYLPYFSRGFEFIKESDAPTVTHRYDSLGRLMANRHPSTSDLPEGALESFEYSPLTKIMKDEEQTRQSSPHFGAFKRVEYDGLSRVRAVVDAVKVDAEGYVSGLKEWRSLYTFDPLDNLTQYEDVQGNVRFMHYDGLARNTYINDPNRGQTWFAYDDAGNLKQTRDARCVEVAYQYDGLNRLLAEFLIPSCPETFSDSVSWSPSSIPENVTPKVRYQYDASSSLLENATELKGRLASIWDEAGSEAFSFDARGRLITKVRNILGNDGNKQFVSKFDYDVANRISYRQYPDKTEVHYYYDNAGQLESIPGVVEQLKYGPQGSLTERTLANGVVSRFDHDERLRLKTVDSYRDELELQQFEYHYDAVSNVLSIDDQRSEQSLLNIAQELNLDASIHRQLKENFTYTYDDFYRLTQASKLSNFVAFNYRYDPSGNMLEQRSSGLMPSTSIGLLRYGNSNNQQNNGAWNRIGKSIGTAPGPNALTATTHDITYDESGNRIQEGDKHYRWDHKHRLIRYFNDDVSAEYRYDSQNIRRYKAIVNNLGQREETFYVDSDTELRNGELIKFVTVLGHKLAQSRQDGGAFTPERFYLAQHLGSTQLSLNNDGEIVAAFTYGPYGEVDNEWGESALEIPYRFTGKETDVESGLGYFEQRYLQQTQGQFLTPDPLFMTESRLLDPQQLNPYAYGRGNPVKFVDPSGLMTELPSDKEYLLPEIEVPEYKHKDMGGLKFVNNVTFNKDKKKIGKTSVTGSTKQGSDGFKTNFEIELLLFQIKSEAKPDGSSKLTISRKIKNKLLDKANLGASAAAGVNSDAHLVAEGSLSYGVGEAKLSGHLDVANTAENAKQRAIQGAVHYNNFFVRFINQLQERYRSPL